ncbi:MAG: hypothetical protein H6981_02185 [Gammaproteobacteria bacterium]|nr:hypothetical protein [Gammaproteobacteria bacterium]MCP5135598.1 hypothetical protein [Gammaproteobacteria bacterium]
MKQRSLKKAVLLGSALSLAALAGHSMASDDAAPKVDPAAQAFAEASAAAEAEIKKAGSTGFEWRDTAKFLEDADKIAKEGDIGKAMKLVAKAKQQAELAQKQAADQANPTWHF